MPLVNYCRKCKTETPPGEACAYCGGKLAKSGERLSFGVVRTPVKDWFEWNRILRVGLPVLALVFVMVVLGELSASGVEGLIALFRQGFMTAMLEMLGGLLALTGLLLWLQGPEKVHYVLNKDGVRACVYLREGDPLPLYARFLSKRALETLAVGEDGLPDLMLIRRVNIPWQALKRVRVWREGSVVLFFRPAYWQALAMRCPPGELASAEAYVRAKVKRLKGVKVLPMEKPISRKKG